MAKINLKTLIKQAEDADKLWNIDLVAELTPDQYVEAVSGYKPSNHKNLAWVFLKKVEMASRHRNSQNLACYTQDTLQYSAEATAARVRRALAPSARFVPGIFSHGGKVYVVYDLGVEPAGQTRGIDPLSAPPTLVALSEDGEGEGRIRWFGPEGSISLEVRQLMHIAFLTGQINIKQGFIMKALREMLNKDGKIATELSVEDFRDVLEDAVNEFWARKRASTLPEMQLTDDQIADMNRRGGGSSNVPFGGEVTGQSLRDRQIDTLRTLIAEKKRRLYDLQLKAARYGFNVPTEITLEMEDLEGRKDYLGNLIATGEIASLEAQLKELKEG